MARKIVLKGAPGGVQASPKARGHLPPVGQGNIDAVERETIERANRTLSALRLAITTWDTSPDKPEELRPKFQKYKMLHDALLEWQKKALRTVDKKGAFDEKVETLWEFVDICQTYA